MILLTIWDIQFIEFLSDFVIGHQNFAFDTAVIDQAIETT